MELARIAAYLHDIGNLINRIDHSQSGAMMAFRILNDLGMAPEEIAAIVAAIGNHDEGTGTPVSLLRPLLSLRISLTCAAVGCAIPTPQTLTSMTE